jgi:hypothetical protein
MGKNFPEKEVRAQNSEIFSALPLRTDVPLL